MKLNFDIISAISTVSPALRSFLRLIVGAFFKINYKLKFKTKLIANSSYKNYMMDANYDIINRMFKKVQKWIHIVIVRTIY